MSALSKSTAAILTALMISSVYAFTPLFVGAAIATEAVADTFIGTEGATLTQAAPGVLTNDTIADGAVLITAVTLVDAPSIPGVFSLGNDGSVSFTPTDTNFTGDVTFTYTISDDLFATSSPATVTMSFTNTPDAPVSINQSIETVENSASSSVLTYTDIDAVNTFVFATTTDPLHGTVVLDAATGAFTYTPAPGYVGTDDSFMWEVFDGTATSAAATVSITVTALPDPEFGISFTVVSNNGVVATTTDTAMFDGATTTGATTTVSAGSHTVSAFPLPGYVISFGGDCAADGTITLAHGDSKHCVITYTQLGSPSAGSVAEDKKPANGPISDAGPLFGSITNFNGLVLGASTTTASTTLPELPTGCTPTLGTFMRRSNIQNSSDDVKKLQEFLNSKENANLSLSGEFDAATDAAVRAFQASHAEQILKPWGLSEPTGFVYLTTQRWINLMSCSTLDLPMPRLVPYVAH
jgi:hypothetical protein